MSDNIKQRTLTYFASRSFTVLFMFNQQQNYRFTCSTKSKTFEKEVSCTVILLPLTKYVSVLCIDHRIRNKMPKNDYNFRIMII